MDGVGRNLVSVLDAPVDEELRTVVTGLPLSQVVVETYMTVADAVTDALHVEFEGIVVPELLVVVPGLLTQVVDVYVKSSHYQFFLQIYKNARNL